MHRSSPSFIIPAFVTVLILNLSAGCIAILNPDEEDPNLEEILAAIAAGGIPSDITSSIVPGSDADLDGDGSVDGTAIDFDGDGLSDGIDTNGDGIAELLFLDSNSNGEPDGIDQNGDGSVDYFFCTDEGILSLYTGADCSDSQVWIVDGDGDGKEDGVDTNGDGAADDTLLADIQEDTTDPSVSLTGPGAGGYGQAQSVTLTCNDDVAPSNILYTLDGSDPAFQPLNGQVSAPPSVDVEIGASGDGTYNLKYLCRDAAGNESSPASATYVIDSAVANISFTSPCTPYVSSGNVSCTWESDKSSASRIVKVGGSDSDCADGASPSGTGLTGSVTADASNSTTIQNSSLSSGSNTLRFCVPNGASVYAIATQTVIKDTASPTVSIASPSDSGPFPSGSTFSASCSDSGESGCLTIAYTTNGTNPTFSGTSISNGNEYTGSTALPDGQYHLKVRAVDRAGNVSSVISQSVVVGPPSTPTGLSATSGNGEVSLTWNSVSNASSYTVYYRSGTGVTTSDSSKSASTNSVTVTGLTNDTAYSFAVVAIHSGGTSVLSGEATATPVSGPPPVFFSEYIEGSGLNKVLEIYNPGADFDLSQCSVRIYINGATSPTTSVNLSGTLSSEGTYVICNSSIDGGATSYCDLLTSSTVMNFNGDDALELYCDSATMDVIGRIGIDPGTEWYNSGVGTQNETLRRKCSVTSGDSNGADSFDPSIGWDSYAQDTYTGLGSHSTCE